MITQELGKKGEEYVISYLRSENFTVLAHNYRFRGGEIDIIAQKDNLVCFIEVKLRQTAYFYLSELITLAKQKKIIKTAERFITEQRWAAVELIYRFDVALLEFNTVQKSYQLTYIPDAFRKEF